MAEVAKQAGVSQPTVSRALSNHPGLPRETCERIQKIARDMGYKRNPYVSAFVANRHSKSDASLTTLACISYHHTLLPSHSAFFEGARERAEALGFQYEFFIPNQLNLSGKRLSKVLFSRNIWGVLILPFRINPSDEPLIWEHFACATTWLSTIHNAQLHYSMPNYLSIMKLAAEKVRAKGYKRIAFMSYLKPYSNMADFLRAGYLLFQDSLPVSQRLPAFIVIENKDWNAANVVQWVKKHKPDAIVSLDHKMTGWLEKAGYRFPEDIYFAGLSKRAGQNRFSYVEQQQEKVGGAATDLIIGQLHRNERGLPEHPKGVLIEPEWVEVQ